MSTDTLHLIVRTERMEAPNDHLHYAVISLGAVESKLLRAHNNSTFALDEGHQKAKALITAFEALVRGTV